MDVLNLSEDEILMKLNKDKLQAYFLGMKNNIRSRWTIKDLILNYYKEIKADIKQLKDDINETKYDFTPVTNQNVSGSISNNLLKLGKQHCIPGKCLTEMVIELCNDVGVMVTVRDIDFFKKKVTSSFPKELL